MFLWAFGRPTEYSAASSSCSVPGIDVPLPLNVLPFQISAMSGDHAVEVVDLVSTHSEAEPTSSHRLVKKESVDCSLNSWR